MDNDNVVALAATASVSRPLPTFFARARGG